MTHGYDYYKNSRKKSYTDPLSKVRSYTYDKAGRSLGITLPNNTQVSMSGYNWNRPTTVNLPGGSSLNYTYNGLQQLLSVRGLDPGSNPVIDYKYTYSAVGNIKTKTTEHGQYGYDYNKVYRLTNATNPNTDTESFDYDGLGNRTESNLIPTWEYNVNNQLIKYGDTSYGYDDQGNMVNRTKSATTTNFIYNLENRLEKVQDSTNTDLATYGYDPYGRRLWKEVGGTKTYFHYTDEGLAGEYDSTGTKLKTYGYHPGSPWSTNPLFVEIDSIYYYYLNDHLGTPQQIIAENGAVVWSARYTSFGEADILTNTIENNLRFPGQYFDSETGLHYNWHRFYDPSTGRYISADPIGLNGGMNLYAYVGGDPVNWVDPMGLIYMDRTHDYTKGEKHKSDPNAITILVIDRGWGDIVKGVNAGWCSYIRGNWNGGFVDCIENLENDLNQCNDPCNEEKNQLCQLKAKLRFESCITNNNTNNGTSYPNNRCF